MLFTKTNFELGGTTLYTLIAMKLQQPLTSSAMNWESHPLTPLTNTIISSKDVMETRSDEKGLGFV